MQKTFILLLLACFACKFSNAQENYSDTANALKPVLVQYNQRLTLWNNTHAPIEINSVMARYYKRPLNDSAFSRVGYLDYKYYQDQRVRDSAPLKKYTKTLAVKSQKESSTFNQTKVLDEVHLGDTTVSRRGFNGSVVKISGDDIKNMPANDVASLIQGRCAGCDIIQSSGEPGSSSNIVIRGPGSLNEAGPLYVIDGVVQPHDRSSLEAGNNINPNDIASMEILKDAGATAIYGAAAAGGVIVITTKSGKGSVQNSNAKTVLSEEEDVDYMQDIQAVPIDRQYVAYLSMEPIYNTNLNFYLDMAIHFYSEGLTKYTDEMMTKAMALCYDTLAGQTAVAFVYEYMKQYDKAINVYKILNKYYSGNLKLVRDLAWVHFENGQYDTAVNILYTNITDPGYVDDEQTVKLKDIMLADMNMMIALQKDKVNTDDIPSGMIKPVPADMRIMLETNNCDLSDISFKQVGKRKLDRTHSIGKDSARLQTAGDDFSLAEFQTAHLGIKGYSITVPYYKGWYAQVPSMVKVVKIKNFGKPNQSIETDISILDNQYGQIVIEEPQVNKEIARQ